METLDTTTDDRLPALMTRLRSSTAAREGLYVLAAQALATVLALGVDRILFQEMGKSERGTLSAALGLRNILLYAADMGLSLTTIRIASAYYGKGQFAEANSVFRGALLRRAIMACGVIIIALLLSPALAGLVLASASRGVLIWAAAAALLGMAATSWGSDVSRSTRRFGSYFFHQVLEAALKTAAVVAVVFIFGQVLSRSSDTVLWALALSSTLAGGLSLLIERRVFDRQQPVEPAIAARLQTELRQFGRYAWAIALIFAIGTQVEILLIAALLGPEQTAIYDGGRRLAMVLPLIAGTLTTVLLPRVAMLDTIPALRNYARKALWVGLAAAVTCSGALAAVSGVLAPWFSYPESTPILRWLTLAYGLAIVFHPVALVLYPMQREGWLLFVYAASLGLSIGVSLWMIPRYGAIGAAWSAMIVKSATLLLLAGVLLNAFRRMGVPPVNSIEQPSEEKNKS